MATQLAQRINTLSSSSAAAQKRAAAPRAPFSSPVLAQLKQVWLCVQFSQSLHTATQNRAQPPRCMHAECQGNLRSTAACCSALREGTGTCRGWPQCSWLALRPLSPTDCQLLSSLLLQAAAVQAAAPATSSYKKSDFELYTLTTWLLQV